MAEYVSNTWFDASEGYRFSLTGVDEALWMPLSEAIALLSASPPPSVMPLRQYFAWRCAHGRISAKAGRLIQTFGDDPHATEYRNMPITDEWKLPDWSADHGEHWNTNLARVIVNRPTGRQIYQYIEIAVDREGVEAFRQLILSQNEPAHSPAKAGEPMVGVEARCRDWLIDQFNADKDNRLRKSHFRAEAMKEFPKGLSERGFNLRVWPDLSKKFFRDGPGAKKKS